MLYVCVFLTLQENANILPVKIRIVILTSECNRDTTGCHPICLQYSYQRKVRQIRLGKSVKLQQWKGDASEYVDEKKHPNARQLNFWLAEQLARAQRIVLEAENKGRELPYDEFKKLFHNLQEPDFFQWHDQFVQYRQSIGSIQDVTVTRYKVQRKKLAGFRSSIKLVDITPAFISDYLQYLSDYLGNGHNTKRKSLVYLKSIFDYAKGKGAVSGDPFGEINMKPKSTQSTFLTQKEVDTLVDLYRSQALKPVFQHVLRKFIWSCYTGQAFSDMIRTRYGDIVDVAGNLCLSNDRIKTDHPYFVPLLPVALELITPMSEDPDELIFRSISNQKYNVIIKEVAGIVGIRKPLTSHVARHTCGHILVAAGVSRDYIMQILGHARISMTQHYSRIMPIDVIREIKDKFKS